MSLTPKEECEQLMNAILPLAEEMLANYGEFYPCGGAMTVEGEIVHISAKGETDHPPSQDLIDLLKDSFRSRRNEYRATAIVADVKTVPPGSQAKTDAIQVLLDHKGGYSVEVFFPYEIMGGKAVFSEPFAAEGQDLILERLRNYAQA